jgi:DNA polymerase-3 subunit delta
MDKEVAGALKEMKAGKYRPVYFLQGEEPYYIDLLSEFAESNAISESERSFNQVILYGKETNMAAVLTHARRYPMMAERQVVIVREAQDIPDLNRDTGSKLLLAYCEKPLFSTVLVFCHKYKTLDRRKTLGKQLGEMAEVLVLTAKKPYENQLPDFVLAHASRKGLTIDEQGVRVLCDYVGGDLNRLANEIDKLGVSANGKPITAELVMSQVGISREYNMFELQKAVLSRDLPLVMKMVKYFEANPKKNPALVHVAVLYTFFSRLLAASAVPDKSERGLVTALRISPYAARDYAIGLKRFSTAEISRAVNALQLADLKLKGVDAGSAGEGQIFRELAFRLVA